MTPDNQHLNLAELILEYCKIFVWPITLVVLVLMFKKRISNFLSRVKKADLPGGVSLETFSEELDQAKSLSHQVAEAPQTRKAENKGPVIPLTEANARMMRLGLIPSPSGLEFSRYRELAQSDPNLALAGLRIELENMLKNLGKGFGVNLSSRYSVSIMLDKLLEHGAVTSNQAQLARSVIRLANAAVHGVPISQQQAEELLDVATVLRDQYVKWLSWGFSK